MEENSIHHQEVATAFIDHCTEKFGWLDLARDIVMDVGCGYEGFCGKALLDKFPSVGSIVGIDSNKQLVRNFRLSGSTKMGCEFADIEERWTLRSYEGQMTKVISINVFHQLAQKEEALRNVFHILKPEGEAAVLFVLKDLLYKWLAEMIKKTKWNEAYKHQSVEDLPKHGADHYREMAEKIGFRVIECREGIRSIPHQSDQKCKDFMYQAYGNIFDIPSELIEEFKEDCLQAMLKLSTRDADGVRCYRAPELSLLLSKPKDASGS